MALNEGQLITYAIDEVIQTIENMTPMAQKVTKWQPDAASLQRSSNEVWLPLEQEAPTQKGWDLTDKQTGILELSVKCSLNEPDNDFFELRADDLRNERSYRRRINASAKKLANNVEVSIARVATDMASLVITSKEQIGSKDFTGWDMVADAEETIFSRELNRNAGLSYFFNPLDYKRAGHDLTSKDFYGRIPEDAYKSGSIQRQVAGFNDVLRSPKLPTVKASTATGVTVSGAQKFKPEAWKRSIDGGKENVDNRIAWVTVSDATKFKRGDKISFADVKFLAQMAKNILTKEATFTVVSTDKNKIAIAPKPIALDDDSLKPEEKAYANVNISLADGAAINILNIKDATANVFWADDSIRLVSQPIPLNHEIFAGLKARSFSIDNVGINGVIAFSGNINNLAGKCRIALWYEPCAIRPESIGIGLAGQKA
ncbi:P22 phage major capsid protein family protein [Arsenophonus sp.]|uniref:P22 phage major capsid protein family protein n=1 Tax=Arsenophonus sp. TaxID=1872640 RepID=UPI0038795327